MMKKPLISIAGLFILILSACGFGEAPATPTPTPMPTSTATSIPSPTATFTATPPPGIHVQISTACYGGPGDTYDVVMTFDAGEQAEIVGRDDAGSYWIVKNPVGEDSCWIESQAVTTEGELGYTPYLVPPPTPTPAAPAPPENFSATSYCDNVWTYIKAKGKWDVVWEVTIKLDWDKATNVLGYTLYKNGYKFKSLDADTTEYTDWFKWNYQTSGINFYSIQAFNLVGESPLSELSVDYVCKYFR